MGALWKLRPSVFSKRLLRDGLALVLVSVALGLPAAAVVARMLDGLLYGIAPTDPVTYAVAGTLLIVTALIACYVPARRAERVTPLFALRTE